MKLFKKLSVLILSILMIFGICTSCDLTQEDIDDIISVIDELTATENPGAPEGTESSQEPEVSNVTPSPKPEETPSPTALPTATPKKTPTPAPIDKNGTYSSKEDVALYIHTYNVLPQNYITKADAESLGWTGGSVEKLAPGKCIGGSYFGNYEGRLPAKEDREYYECDIDTLGGKPRGEKRLVYSNDGLIYYTEDHYETFELLYGGK